MVVHRFADGRDPGEHARRRGLDQQAVGELLDVLGPASRELGPRELLDAPFRPKPQLSRPATRFSDGSWPVFYSALNKETAEREIAHHIKADDFRSLLGDPPRSRTIYFSYFHCTFAGTACDLRPKVAEWPELVDPRTVNPTCQQLGAEAKREGIDGFLAPSARRPDGTTTPVFVRERLSDAAIDGDAAFTLDERRGEIGVRYA
jgi:hypothetical protein